MWRDKKGGEARGDTGSSLDMGTNILYLGLLFSLDFLRAVVTSLIYMQSVPDGHRQGLKNVKRFIIIL